MLLFRELRLVAVDLENDPAVVAGATLASIVSTAFVEKRGEAAVDAIEPDTPAAPAISGDQVRVWLDTRTGVEPGRYILRATVTLSNGETAQGEEPVVVE